MADHEMLELAARAYFGAGGFEWNACSGYIEYIPSGSRSYLRWMPLTDDGDALRLAVKLDIEFSDITDGMRASYVDDGRIIEDIEEAYSTGDFASQMAATRRVIVRAAAAIAD